MKKQVNCVKAIPYHEILTLQEINERLSSWQSMLEILEIFFSDENPPVNKKKIIRDYHTCAKIFKVFQKDYGDLILREAQGIEKMIEGEKISDG
ncbi:hypothetical protein [Candidatus Enterococcus clewellii]|uniref:Uncharacterized protein n=1 Tax=Candidatus Enterococcus clewellii TaxID=1834193 RepID=A0A242K6S7_9ENTE|nr:hypothetical protein [Enterococcus sp. 9E7_DIV0242]OTP16018.1 hypothetical protein A5888_002232 [Enterococcus sp. 9E7_DIV0242]OTP16021.1 hypothetical protein A5888_002235 [Enterococcus sp. 9E7_DIV0242]